ncbi:MAG: cytochrome C oxidase subunit IV family protein, partial [Sediminibacterium sp.]
MEHTHAEHQSGGGTKEIWKVTIILTVLTIIELALGFLMIGIPLEKVGVRLLIKGVIVILMMAKAFYIVAYFMHLKHEIRNLIMTIIGGAAFLGCQAWEWTHLYHEGAWWGSNPFPNHDGTASSTNFTNY